MVDIMDDLQKHVPTLTTTNEYTVSGSDEPVEFTIDDFHYILFGKCSTVYYVLVDAHILETIAYVYDPS